MAAVESRSSYNATIVEKRQLNPLLAIFKVRPQGDERFEFKPGQTTTLGLLSEESRIFNAQPESSPPPPGTILQRRYSICNDPTTLEAYEFYVMLIVGGPLTPRLFDRRKGDGIKLGGRADGGFTLERVDPDKPLLLVATGTGLSPYISMIRDECRRGRTRPLIVLEGVRYSWNLGYRQELEALSREHDHIHYIPTITRVELDPDWSGPVGHLDELLEDQVVEKHSGLRVNPEEFEVLLCGNPKMVDSVERWFVGRGFRSGGSEGEPETIHTEKYWTV